MKTLNLHFLGKRAAMIAAALFTVSALMLSGCRTSPTRADDDQQDTTNTPRT
jgi:starvation-inducible outer membrane lipoprotein